MSGTEADSIDASAATEAARAVRLALPTRAALRWSSSLRACTAWSRSWLGVGEGRRYCDEPIVDVGMRALAAVQLLKDIAFELRSAGLIQNGTDVFQFEEVTAAAHQLRVQRAVGESTYDWLCRIHMSLHGQGAP